MAFSSRLKRKNEATSAVHNRAIYQPDVEKLLQICQLHSDFDALAEAALATEGDERAALMTEMREIKALISELRNG
jgi:hypothetical protein